MIPMLDKDELNSHKFYQLEKMKKIKPEDEENSQVMKKKMKMKMLNEDMLYLGD